MPRPEKRKTTKSSAGAPKRQLLCCHPAFKPFIPFKSTDFRDHHQRSLATVSPKRYRTQTYRKVKETEEQRENELEGERGSDTSVKMRGGGGETKLVKMVSEPEEWPAFASYLEDIKSLQSGFHSSQIIHVPRTDRLARSARQQSSFVIHIDAELPIWCTESI
ncbi:hypothetical protein Rs2_41228 [Raphanus sativus]|nr:hypothetical protein Rs2_41228 [Raphanus sativus]